MSIQAQILNLLKDLQEQLNLTILFISRDLPVVRQMCDRIAVLKNGKVCEINDTEKLFMKPTHHYTKELLNLIDPEDPLKDLKLVLECLHLMQMLVHHKLIILALSPKL